MSGTTAQLDVRVSRIAFLNKKEQYREWRGKTLGLADSMGFGGVLRTRKVIPTLVEYEAADASQETKTRYKHNALGYNLLLMSVTRVSYCLVEEAEGDAFDAITALDQKWATAQQEDLTQLQEEFTIVPTTA
jgi:hypothetical protein